MNVLFVCKANKNQADEIQRRFPESGRRVICLGIPDSYEYGAAGLQHALETALEPWWGFLSELESGDR